MVFSGSFIQALCFSSIIPRICLENNPLCPLFFLVFLPMMSMFQVHIMISCAESIPEMPHKSFFFFCRPANRSGRVYTLHTRDVQNSTLLTIRSVPSDFQFGNIDLTWSSENDPVDFPSTHLSPVQRLLYVFQISCFRELCKPTMVTWTAWCASLWARFLPLVMRVRPVVFYRVVQPEKVFLEIGGSTIYPILFSTVILCSGDDALGLLSNTYTSRS